MSGKNNVNPDHYKTAGRDRQGADIQPEIEKRKYSVTRRTARKRRARR
jgi:hypothetical protein